MPTHHATSFSDDAFLLPSAARRRSLETAALIWALMTAVLLGAAAGFALGVAANAGAGL